MKEITCIALIVAGVIVGIFVGKEYFSDCSALTVPAGYVQLPVLQSTAINDSVAHQYSENFRKSMNYCEDKKSDIDLHKLGLFELSKGSILEMYAAALALDSLNEDRQPQTYRCFFGDDEAGNTRLMMVGMYASASSRVPSELSSHIIPLTENLPCPRLCDAPFSRVIFGGDGSDACAD